MPEELYTEQELIRVYREAVRGLRPTRLYSLPWKREGGIDWGRAEYPEGFLQSDPKIIPSLRALGGIQPSREATPVPDRDIEVALSIWERREGIRVRGLPRDWWTQKVDWPNADLPEGFLDYFGWELRPQGIVPKVSREPSPFTVGQERLKVGAPLPEGVEGDIEAALVAETGGAEPPSVVPPRVATGEAAARAAMGMGATGKKQGQPPEVDWDAFAKLWPEEGQAMVAGAKMLYEQQASVVGFGGEISWPYPTAADAMNAYMEMAFMLQKVTPKVPVPEVADPDVITEEKPIQTEFGGKTWRATQTTQTKGGVTTLTSIRLDEVMDEAGKTFNLVPHAGGLYMYDPADPKGTLRELIKAEVDKSGRQIITAGGKTGLLTWDKEGKLASVDWDVLKPPETLEEKEEARLRREGLAQDLQLKRFQLEAARAAERLAREDREEARHQATMQRFEGLVASANLQIMSGNLEAAGLRRTGEAAMDAFMTTGPTGPRGWAWLLEGMQQQRAADVIDANVVAAQKFSADLQSYMAETEKRHAASMAAIEGQPTGIPLTNIVTAQPQATEPAMPSAREPRLVTLPGTVGSTPFGGATPPGFGAVGDFLSNEQINQALFGWKMGGEPGEPPRKWWWETPQWQAANVEPSPFTGGSMPSPFAGEGGPPRRQALRVFA